MPVTSLMRVVCLVGIFVALSSATRADEVQWRSDYTASRRESVEKDRPLVLNVGSEGCVWCRRQDVSTFRDPSVVRLLGRHFVSVRIDASRNELLAEKLRLRAYPTILLASPDGRILEVLEGYQDAASLLQRLEGVLTQLGRSETTVSVVRTEGPSAELRGQRARELLAQLREEQKAGQYAACLQHCDLLTTHYSDSPAAEDARRAATEIRSNPEWMRQACESLGDQLGNMYLTLAETHMKRGQPQQAVVYLERVVQTLPGSRAADTAQRRLAQIQGVPTRFGEAKDR